MPMTPDRYSNQREDLEAYSTYPYYYTRFVHTIIRYYAVGSQYTPCSDQSGHIYIAQQRSVAPCEAVRCGAVPFAAVLCRAALCAFFRT